MENYRKNEQFGFDTQGLMWFANWSSVTTGNALADLYLGRMWQYTEGTEIVDGRAVGGYGKGHWRMSVFEPYFQDDWKVNPRLTLNLGMRYYYFTALRDFSAVNVDSAFVPSQYNPAAQTPVVWDPVLGGPAMEPNTGNNYMKYGNGLVACGTNGVPKGCYFPDHQTFAPRFGFAYDVFGTGKTVIRGGYGVYFEMGNGNESNAEGSEGNPPVSLAPTVYNVAGYNSIYPLINPAGQPIPPASSFTAIPLYQKFPSVQQFSFGIQHEFPGNNLLSLGYVGSLGRHLARSRQANQVPLGMDTMQVPTLAGFPGCDAAGNCDVQNLLINGVSPPAFFVPCSGYNSIVVKENTPISNYNALQANFRHTVGKGLTFEASYTWSHAIDDASSTYSQKYVDDSNLGRWRATSDMNRTQVPVMNFIYELPFFKTRPSAAARSLLGGWKVSGITSFFTGVPINFGFGGLVSGIGEGVNCNSLGRLRIKKGVVNDAEFGPTPTWFDPNTIGQVTPDQLRADGQPGMFGYMGRNVLTGPGRNNWDIALLKEFELPWFGDEHSKLQFRWETYNTFNHPQWGFGNPAAGIPAVNVGCDIQTPPGNPCGPATLADGTPINTRNGEVNAAWPARIMQFGLKLIF